MSVHHPANGVVAPALESGTSWCREAWLAPRLAALALLAILLSVAGGRLGAGEDVMLALHLIAYGAGGFYGGKKAIAGLLQGEIDVDLLMVLAALGAAALGEWQEGALLLFLFSLSNVLQDYAIGRSRGAIKSLFALYPEVATIKRGGAAAQVPISEIQVGDTVLIEPGARIPVDGLVIAGASAVDESPITGESLPVDKAAGAKVFAGTLNKEGSLDVSATRAAGQTTLARIITLVEEAQDSKARAQQRLESFEGTYAKFIIFSVIGIILLPPLLGTADFESNFYRAMVLMTVASPCALVISVPAALISAIAAAARNGILFKGGASLEQLAAVQVVAFDKTGTLTAGSPRVTDIAVAAGTTEAELIALAAAVEARSEHPLAKAIVAEAASRGIRLAEVADFAALPGSGARGRVGEIDVRVGRLSQLGGGIELPANLLEAQGRFERAGQTTVAVLGAGEALGLIALADELRPQSLALVRALHQRGIMVAMLTGDNRFVAAAIARQLGIRRVHAELMPADKSTILRELQRELGTVAMVGDGINDAPALAIADVGVALGAAGSDVALEAADVVLMGDRLEALISGIDFSRRARRVVKQNIAFSLAVIALLLLGVLLVELPLPLGVLGHEGSTVIVVLNGLLSLLILPEIRRQLARRKAAPSA